MTASMSEYATPVRAGTGRLLTSPDGRSRTTSPAQPTARRKRSPAPAIAVTNNERPTRAATQRGCGASRGPVNSQVAESEAAGPAFVPVERLSAVRISERRVLVTGGVTSDARVLPLSVVRFLDHVDDEEYAGKQDAVRQNDGRHSGLEALSSTLESSVRTPPSMCGAHGDDADPVFEWQRALVLSSRKRATIPVSREAQTLTLDPTAPGQMLLLVGGLRRGQGAQDAAPNSTTNGNSSTNTTPCSTLFAYHVERNKWEELKVEPVSGRASKQQLCGPRFAHSAVFRDATTRKPTTARRARTRPEPVALYVFGGYDSMSARSPRREVHKLSISQATRTGRTYTWSLIKPVSPSASARKRVSNDVASKVDNPPASQVRVSAPARASHASCLYRNRYMIVHGGRDGAAKAPMNAFCDDLLIFDLETCEWMVPSSVSGDIPSARAYHSATDGVGGDEGCFMFFGGVCSDGTFSDELFRLELSVNEHDGTMSAVWRKRHLSSLGAGHNDTEDDKADFAAAHGCLVSFPHAKQYLYIGGRNAEGLHISPFAMVPFDEHGHRVVKQESLSRAETPVDISLAQTARCAHTLLVQEDSDGIRSNSCPSKQSAASPSIDGVETPELVNSSKLQPGAADAANVKDPSTVGSGLERTRKSLRPHDTLTSSDSSSGERRGTAEAGRALCTGLVTSTGGLKRTAEETVTESADGSAHGIETAPAATLGHTGGSGRRAIVDGVAAGSVEGPAIRSSEPRPLHPKTKPTPAAADSVAPMESNMSSRRSVPSEMDLPRPLEVSRSEQEKTPSPRKRARLCAEGEFGTSVRSMTVTDKITRGHERRKNGTPVFVPKSQDRRAADALLAVADGLEYCGEKEDSNSPFELSSGPSPNEEEPSSGSARRCAKDAAVAPGISKTMHDSVAVPVPETLDTMDEDTTKEDNPSCSGPQSTPSEGPDLLDEITLPQDTQGRTNSGSESPFMRASDHAAAAAAAAAASRDRGRARGRSVSKGRIARDRGRGRGRGRGRSHGRRTDEDDTAADIDVLANLENECPRENCRVVLNEVLDAGAKRREAEARVRELERDKASLAAKVEDALRVTSERQRRIDMLQKELLAGASETTGETVALRETAAKCQERLREVQTENRRLASEVVDLQADKDSLESQLSDSNATVRAVRSVNKALLEKCEGLEQRHEIMMQLEAAASELQTRSVRQQKRIEALVSENEGTARTVKLAREQATREVERERAKVQDVERELQARWEECVRLREQTRELEGQRDRLIAERDRSRGDPSSKTGGCNDHSQKCPRAECAEALERARSLGDDLDSVRRTSATAVSELEVCRRRLGAAEQAERTRARELDTCSATLADMRQQLASAHSEGVRLRARAADAERERQTAKAAVDTALARLRAAEHALVDIHGTSNDDAHTVCIDNNAKDSSRSPTSGNAKAKATSGQAEPESLPTSHVGRPTAHALQKPSAPVQAALDVVEDFVPDSPTP